MKKETIKKPKNMFEWANLFEQVSIKDGYEELVKGIVLYELGEHGEHTGDQGNKLTVEEKKEIKERYDKAYNRYMKLDSMTGFLSEEIRDIFNEDDDYLF